MPRTFEQLDEFILRARRAGRATPQIRELLQRAGWKPEQVEPYLADEELVPPPPPAARTTGRDVFFYLLAFFTLAISAISLGGIVFGLINRFFPDQVLNMPFQPGQLHWSLAWFIVGAPVFFLVTRRLVLEVPPDAAQAPAIRRVLTYLAMFLASATIIGDVAALVYRFVSGTVTARFGLKVVAVLLLGGWVLWYYWIGLRQGERGGAVPRSWQRNHAAAFSVAAVLAVVSGFMLAGAPSEQRTAVRDEQRVQDLVQMYAAIQSYYGFEKKMPSPDTLSALYDGPLPGDPMTGEPYEYVPGEGSQFLLCATFEAASSESAYPAGPKPRYEPFGGSWNHPAGRHCFELQVREAPAQ